MLPLAPVHTVGLSAYVGITIAAALEGEITFVGAAALVSQGMLDPVAVIAAGATGAALGDQFYFYAFRGSSAVSKPAAAILAAALLIRVGRKFVSR